MSKKLDEAKLLADITQVIEDYGKQVVFFEADDTEHTIWATPPRESKETFGEGNAPETLSEFLVPNDENITFDIQRAQRVRIETTGKKFRIERIRPIRSGENVVVYKIFIAR